MIIVDTSCSERGGFCSAGTCRWGFSELRFPVGTDYCGAGSKYRCCVPKNDGNSMKRDCGVPVLFKKDHSQYCLFRIFPMITFLYSNICMYPAVSGRVSFILSKSMNKH